ncbi:MAG: amino acid permease, partial [Verrucomicrobia bacterium]|nr:amino acid permease [Verrucomicrobiota bacterium]
IERLLPRGGNLLVVLAVIFASTSALNATIYSATRAAYALGRDHMLPNIFARISGKTKTPWGALAFTGVLVLLVAGCLDADQVAASASIMFLLLFFLVNICVIRIRYNMGDELEYGFLMPLFPVFPIVAIICQGVLAVFLHEMGRTAWILAPTWMGIGGVIYYTYARHRATASADEIRIIEEQKGEAGDEYRVMVGVSDPRHALDLIRSTFAICEARQARIDLIHMVEVPDQIALTDAEQYLTEGREAVGEVGLYLGTRFPLSTTMRYCRNTGRGIVSAAREKRTQCLIMGWQGKRRTRGFTLGSTLDPVLERVPCDVVIIKQVSEVRCRRVLVPVAGGPNSMFAIEIASILADPDVGEIVVLTIQTGRSEKAVNLAELLEAMGDQLTIPSERVRMLSIASRDIVGTIIRETEREDSPYDLVVIGATREPLLAQFTRESMPERVLRNCRKPIAMVQAAGRMRSVVRRWV